MNASHAKPEAKCEDKDESSDELEQFPKIVDVNDFCLIKIFENLDIQSLLNIAEANAHLRPAAADVYKRKFDKTVVEIVGPSNGTLWELLIADANEKPLKVCNNTIQIQDSKTCLQYLRYFGPFIRKLSIPYKDSKIKQYIHEYMNDYCAETLIHIKFLDMKHMDVDQFPKVFPKIKHVTFVRCYFDNKWSSFLKLFPNLRRLTVSDGYSFIEKPFKDSEYLSIESFVCDGTAPIKFVRNILDVSHRLKSFNVGFYESQISISEFLDLIKDKPSITELSAPCLFGLVTSAEIQRLISEHPALIKLNLETCRTTPTDIIAVTRQLVSLKQFKFHTHIHYDSKKNFKAQLSQWHLTVDNLSNDQYEEFDDIYITINRRAEQK